MVTYLRNNVGIPADGGFVPTFMYPDGQPINSFSFDPDKAARLLADAGYPNGKDLPELTITTNATYQDQILN